MKVLVDMNLAPSWVQFLDSHGFTATHWSDVGAPNAPDLTLTAWARDNGHVVFTHDLDFGVILAMTGASGPSVLQVRTLDVLPSAIGAQVVAALRAHQTALLAGAIVSVDSTSARVRVLPFRAP